MTVLCDLFNFMDYRAYLKARVVYEKEANKRFSFRYFARVAGLGSPGFLKMVMDGTRNLTPATISQFAKAFKLTTKEEAYFEALVLFNQAKTDKERDLYFERLKSLKPKAKLKGLVEDQFEYFTKKYFVMIREMVALPGFKEDPDWIAKRLRLPLTHRDITHALDVLLRLGLLTRREGLLVQGEASLTTDAEVPSVELYNYHREMLNEAKEALLTIGPQLRDVTSLTIPIPHKSIPEIKKRIQNFREEIIDLINKGPQDFDDVFQLNIQLFPVTKSG